MILTPNPIAETAVNLHCTLTHDVTTHCVNPPQTTVISQLSTIVSQVHFLQLLLQIDWKGMGQFEERKISTF